MLGERIRTLRKQRKMTLEALAGEKLTKGMLSQIENNKARPSMESLEYIAERLGVDISELLEKVSIVELRKVLEEAEKIHEEFRIYFKHSEETIEQCSKLTALIEPYISNLNESYESARLLEIYSRSLFCLNKKEWTLYCDKAALIYDLLNLTANRANIAFFRGINFYLEHRYQDALQCYLEERHHIETTHIKIDPMTKVTMDYHIAALYSAIGDIKATSEAVESALEYSRKEKLYYKIDDIYKLATVVALLVGDEEKFHYYLKKLKQYGEFVEDKIFEELCDVIYVEYLLHVKGEYHQAMPIIDQYLTFDENTQKVTGDNWNMLQKGKAMYFAKAYSEALHILKTIYVPKHTNHPVDQAIYFSKDIFIALCYKELNNIDKARDYAKIAYDCYFPLPDSIFKTLCNETYKNICLS
ncbi:XRE family transcriptional regulator [Niallia circulans]|uniref:helix-turn-helix domain-containing protein n=1 Tax=Niallia circulans TaxID=1397 RepID=UPI00077CCC7F|nr:helix-turn-helix transcriptional regulator [Niallia circulans]MDR4317978.1 helix-turn-helix transcriptional regulator [Niallia circulans]MED3839049.1 helix-turn-helix transcriptional regulator [Niallia circulans]MED4242164.1 helix-turn-helix transcriptional regulator [Niallia circulans]MED4250728.1 helix-turn-helix transcriptional regulator [Niallia circulans]QKH60764.1 helix-turn-helix transcriptional regulator [Niallia circulans]